jgi:CheR methyltransferase, all-alpha domain
MDGTLTPSAPISSRANNRSDRSVERHAARSAAALETLLEFLKRSRGFDFTGYKRTSLERRIRRRMDAVGCQSFGDCSTSCRTRRTVAKSSSRVAWPLAPT